MLVNVTDVARLVRSSDDAEQVITELLLKFGSTAAQERIYTEATFQKQSAEEVVRRTSNNLLRSFKDRRDRW